ncbi:MAG: hypothetical protein HOM11_14325 [Methylococcales bacterium]|nr:hypothetical protein [Methylococcales bacterium]MBT7446070.1 hypothetical protein [Methylococcales bacterium]
MAKHLTNRDIEAILNIIHAHDNEKLTWEGICEAAEGVVGKKPTRQSLSANQTIKEAYKAKKVSLKLSAPTQPKPSSLTAAADRIARLQSENDTLKMKNDALLEQFVRWQYNAYKYGLKERQLNEPLPRIDRERTE